MSRVAAVHPVLPDHRYPQREITELFADVCLGPDGGTSSSSGCTPAPRWGRGTWRCRWSATATSTASARGQRRVHRGRRSTSARAPCCGALERAGLRAGRRRPDRVSTTVTGVAVPSIEARIADRHRPAARRPAGAAARAGLRRRCGRHRPRPRLPARPSRPRRGAVVGRAVLADPAARRRRSTANLVASGLFGDGAAAVVAARRRPRAAARAPRGPGPRYRGLPQPPLPRHRAGDGLGRRRRRPEDRARRRGARPWSSSTSGPTCGGSSATTGSRWRDVTGWVCHPGGPKVMEAIGVGARAARRTR